jgi:cell division protein FtsA
MAREYKDVVVGLDIGTAKVMAVVAEVLPNGELKLAGLGVAPSNGLKRGVVVNIDATVQSIQQALKEAELMADCKIQRVYTGITGSHIRGLNSSGMVAVKDKEVTSADVARVVETAKAINISSDQRLLLVEPQEFVIDGQDVKEPIGMSGIRLEAKIHIVTGAQSAAENIIKCVRRADRRRARAGCGGGGHWRGHDRCGHLHRRRDPPHGSDSDCGRPHHQRHRHGAAHAHQGR